MTEIIDPAEIAAMTDEEIASANRNMLVRLLLIRIVIPGIIVVGAHLVKKLESQHGPTT
jgi:flagellar biogenesis protein FliO